MPLWLSPIVAWCVSETIKLIVRAIQTGKIGGVGSYGGMPSTHATIVGTIIFLVGLREGFNTPIFALAVTLAYITIIDALVLRRHIGRHAALINRLLKDHEDHTPVRERVWHSPLELLAGLVLGFGVACVLNRVAG